MQMVDRSVSNAYLDEYQVPEVMDSDSESAFDSVSAS